MFQTVKKSFPDMNGIASQNLFLTSGKVGVAVYSLVGATSIDRAGPDAFLSVGFDGDEDAFQADDDGGMYPIPAETIWQQSSAIADGSATDIFPGFRYLDGQAIELYKTGGDAITQGILDIVCIWFPVVPGSGATVTAV